MKVAPPLGEWPDPQSPQNGSRGLQPTAYTRFEDSTDGIRMAVHTVLAESEHDRLGVVHRVGLRYTDLVRPKWRRSLRSTPVRPGIR